MLREIWAASIVCSDLPAFQEALEGEVCFAVVTEEAVRSVDLRAIVARLQEQPAWSDLPFILLTHRREGPESSASLHRLSELLGNVTFLERPFQAATFMSVARSALKTRQRQYEARVRMEELHESGERLRTALLAGRLGSWELDLTNWVFTASPACKAVYGQVAEASFSYGDLITILHPEDRPRMQQALREIVRVGSNYAFEYRTIWPDGSIHWVETRARLMRDRAGQNRQIAGVSSDITDRKMAEETLAHLNEALEKRVAERTAQLEQAHATILAEIEQREQAEAQLRQAQKMEMIGQLTGGVAHDFNNLLMVVLGNLNMLRKNLPDDPKLLRYIDGALQGAQRGATLTQRLLAFARRQELKVEPKNLVELVCGMTDLIERSVGPGIEVRLDLASTVPLALLDANQIELALLNLVVNARDAMPGGGVLSIAVDQGEQTADLTVGYVRLTVSDTGHGMDADTLVRATEPFFSTKGVGKGTGLGLSMIQGLAEQLNGSLRLTSKLGHGTKAELWLPVATGVKQETVAEPSEPHDTGTAKLTIMVVDDDALIAMSTADMLEDLGHEVIAVHSGGAALEILQKSRPVDVLITDYAMPKMSGAQLAKQARDVRPNLPILLATGYADLPAGADVDIPRISKPYQQEQLAAEIRKMLR